MTACAGDDLNELCRVVFFREFDVGHGVVAEQIPALRVRRGLDGFEWGLQLISPKGTGQRWASDIRDSEHQADWGTAPLQ